VNISTAQADAYVLERLVTLARELEALKPTEAAERLDALDVAADAAAAYYEAVIARMRGLEGRALAAWEREEEAARVDMEAKALERDEARRTHGLQVTHDIDVDALGTMSLEEQRELVGAHFPVIFARGDASMPIAERLWLLRPDEAPQDLPGDRRMQRLREHFA
jgi:hypothetical protein